MKITVRAIEPSDYEAIRDIMSQPRAQAGTLRMNAFRNGEYVDAYAMARLKK